MQLEQFIRDIPDFPTDGIIFKDITPLLQNPEAFRSAIDRFVERTHDQGIQKIVAIESRGFIFGSPLADRLGVGIAVARKKGKLPYKTISATYALEYGTNTIEMHEDSIAPNERCLIIDDVLATGGTSRAAAELVHRLGGVIVSFAFLIELGFLSGRTALPKNTVESLITY